MSKKENKTMNRSEQLKLLKQLSLLLAKYTPAEIDKGIITYFLSELSYLPEGKESYAGLEEIVGIFISSHFPVDIEMLINFFGYFIESDIKRRNGIVFTPKYIADHIVKEILDEIPVWDENVRIIDPCCGCGIFLISAIEEIHNRFGIGIQEIIEKHIYGIDILSSNIRRSHYILYIYCLMNGVFPETLKCNLVTADSLSSDWASVFSLSDKFTAVIGNFPYFNTHDMSKEQISYLKSTFTTAKSGNFNIFYAFIEQGLKQIACNGYMEFIVPNNFLTIKTAEVLRAMLMEGRNIYSILDFADNMIFKPVKTYNCIVKLSKSPRDKFWYSVMNETDDIEGELAQLSYRELHTSVLNKHSWILADDESLKNISRIESQKYPIKEYIRTGITTLKDSVYMVSKSDTAYFKIVDNISYPIEAGIVKPVYKIPELKNCVNPKEAMQYIIFPYIKGLNGYELIKEDIFRKEYPNTYAYLLKMKPLLDERDKGRKNKFVWYAYGRSQGLNKYGKKLVFPTYASHPKFIYIDNEDTLFCNGYAIFENQQFSLAVLEKILNSSIMDYYVAHTSYPIEGGFYCYQKKYIERFSIPELSQEEICTIIRSSQQAVNEMLMEKYGLTS